ncbi:MAG TPA: epoxide hydrolase [Candidatus Limnocylindrales bacterium]
MVQIDRFDLSVPQSDLDDLADRLRRVRFTDPAPSEEYGVALEPVKRLVEYWRDGYDWRAWEARLNAYPHFTTEIDGQRIHFMHVRSPEPGAFPLILTHGWPGSIVEFLRMIDPLTRPGEHGGDPADAFHLVIPSLPGFGFSGPAQGQGWTTERTAQAWAKLMSGLGYERYGAHGNDAGSMVSPALGRADGEHVTGVHITQMFSFPSGDPKEFEDMSPEDMAALGKLQWFMENKFSFNQLHSQQPQTLAHALADSPTGLLAWNAQLMLADAMGTQPLDDDFILTNASIYWLTNTGGSSIRFYYEDAKAGHQPTEPTTVPIGLAGFAGDFSGVRRFAERDHANLVQWNVYDAPGGHYAAHLEPEIMATDIRAFFRERRA